MDALPHLYKAMAQGAAENVLILSSEKLPAIAATAPKQFDGPGDQWSPEELLMASLSSCLVLTFRAIAKASKLKWNTIECESQGTLDKVDRKIKFTSVTSVIKLIISVDESIEKANRLIQKAEESCFVSNSLSCEFHLECEVVIGEGVVA